MYVRMYICMYVHMYVCMHVGGRLIHLGVRRRPPPPFPSCRRGSFFSLFPACSLYPRHDHPCASVLCIARFVSADLGFRGPPYPPGGMQIRVSAAPFRCRSICSPPSTLSPFAVPVPHGCSLAPSQCSLPWTLFTPSASGEGPHIRPSFTKPPLSLPSPHITLFVVPGISPPVTFNMCTLLSFLTPSPGAH